MTTLSKVTDATRKILAIGAMISIALFLLYFGIKIGLGIKEALHPTPPPPPTVAFGTLPPVAFPSQKSPLSFTYSLNTVTGDFPIFSDRAKVYKIQPISPSLLALQKLEDSVKNVGFIDKPQAVSETDYQWTNTENPAKILTINTQSNNFTISSDYKNNSVVLGAANIPDQPTANTTTTTFLTSLGIFPNDLDANKTKVTLFSISNNDLVPATSLSTAQIVRVDYFQQDKDKMPIVYTTPSESSMYFLLASTVSPTSPQIVEAHFSHQIISDQSATYPIKTAQQAFKELKDGNAYIPSYATNTNVTIRNISLAYFMSDTSTQYLMPIIVFQGDNNFFAYVSAIKNSWIQK